MYWETVIFIGALAAIAFYASIYIRKLIRWVKEEGLKAFGYITALLGFVLILIAFIADQLGWELFKTYLGLYTRIGLALIALGALLYAVSLIIEKLREEKAWEIEKERRKYLERIRFGLPIERAEEIAKKHIKERVGKNTKLVASIKEFKHWAVYLKDKEGKYYRVVIDGEGRIVEWQTMNEIPPYMLAP